MEHGALAPCWVSRLINAKGLIKSTLASIYGQG